MAPNRKQIARLQTAVILMQKGLPTAVPADATFQLEEKLLTREQVLAKAKEWEAYFDKVDGLEAELVRAREDRAKAVEEAMPFMGLMKHALISRLGEKSPKLPACGIEPRKPPTPLSAEKQALKVQRSLATREARHTKGPKQKKDIKGVVPPPKTDGDGT